ncbi:class I SAM-dependent methyltransferase [Sphaerisporangium flaviroseum]|uniref:Class I SAM-dependent methyltransferase n=1 Tax=Sphaerisporangium flaviroseum TaxID=509199 RepID=A0ABP7HN31_9ACTN
MEPGLLFDGAAVYYNRYRHGYGEEVVDHMARELALGRRSRVLDLGCGPGTLAIPLARFAGAVVAVDPSDDMLAEGRRRSPANVQWLKGDSSRLKELPLRRVDHVVMGRSFHWMDRARVLADLDGMLPPTGAVVLVGPTATLVEPPWEPVAQAVRQSFALEWPVGNGSFQRTGRHHPELLAESPFSRLSTASFHRTAVRDTQAVIGLQLSFSYSSPARLGDRLPAFLERLEQALVESNPTETWEEEIATEVVVARRP